MLSSSHVSIQLSCICSIEITILLNIHNTKDWNTIKLMFVIRNTVKAGLFHCFDHLETLIKCVRNDRYARMIALCQEKT